MAAPERMECVPTSVGAMWRKSSPIAETASRNAFAICFDVMWSMRSHRQMAEMGVSLVDLLVFFLHFEGDVEAIGIFE